MILDVQDLYKYIAKYGMEFVWAHPGGFVVYKGDAALISMFLDSLDSWAIVNWLQFLPGWSHAKWYSKLMDTFIYYIMDCVFL